MRNGGCSNCRKVNEKVAHEREREKERVRVGDGVENPLSSGWKILAHRESEILGLLCAACVRSRKCFGKSGRAQARYSLAPCGTVNAPDFSVCAQIRTRSVRLYACAAFRVRAFAPFSPPSLGALVLSACVCVSAVLCCAGIIVPVGQGGLASKIILNFRLQPLSHTRFVNKCSLLH